jgi:hypothetical protein
MFIGLILGYGYWHSSTHASFHVELKMEDETGKDLKSLPGAEVKFLDSEGRVLATGISDERYNFVHLIHPEVGDCHDVEKEAPFSKAARNAWQKCFARQSIWIPRWVREVRQVEINYQECLYQNIPITVSEYNSGWYLWWVPLPHVGGKPYTYFSARIIVEERDC